MRICAAAECTEEADGTLIHDGRPLAEVCDVHGLAVGAERHENELGDGNAAYGSALYLLRPEHAEGWMIRIELAAPSPVLWWAGDTPPPTFVKPKGSRG